MNVEWHSLATPHGKGVCYGIQGAIKGLARMASLQNLHEEQIMVPRQLYDSAAVNILSPLRVVQLQRTAKQL
jgi:hypothetical protein